MRLLGGILNILVWGVLLAVAAVLVYLFIVMVAIFLTVLAAGFYLVLSVSVEILFGLPELFHSITGQG